VAWYRTDNDYYEHPKFDELTLAAESVWHRGIAWSHRNMTDGYIRTRKAVELASKANDLGLTFESLADELVGAGLWEVVEGGYQIHDYLEYQDSKSEVEEKRLRNSVRQALFRDDSLKRAIRDRDGDRCRYCGRAVDFRDRRSGEGGTYDHIDPMIGNTIDNLVVSCRACNSSKGARTPQQATKTILPVAANHNLNVTSYESDNSSYVQVYNKRIQPQVQDKTTQTTTATATARRDVTSYVSARSSSQLTEPCSYETQIAPQVMSTACARIERASQKEMGEDWVRQRIREAFVATGGSLAEDVVRTRFMAAAKQVQSNAVAYHEGTLRKNLRTSLSNYARGTFIGVMTGEPRR
jgi:5-methylcytosine-specific restriction endonuclease McrA